MLQEEKGKFHERESMEKDLTMNTGKRNSLKRQLKVIWVYKYIYI